MQSSHEEDEPAARLVTVEARPTAMVAEATTWEAFPALWRSLLDEVWRAARGHPGIAPGRNIMLYRDDEPNVEVGVEAAGPFEPIGRVVPSTLPSGRAVTATHRGRYEDMGRAHRAVADACERLGVERTGPSWEIYGHHNDASPIQEVEVYLLVREPT
jgi:effector-binding domain-containing protein